MKLAQRTEKENNNTTVPTMKEVLFAQQFVKNKGNGTKTAMEVYNLASKGGSKTLQSKKKTASVISAENLAKPRIVKMIDDILEENGLTDEFVAKIHRRNMLQDKQLAVSQTAVKDYYTVKGIIGEKKENKAVNIAFIVNK